MPLKISWCWQKMILTLNSSVKGSNKAHQGKNSTQAPELVHLNASNNLNYTVDSELPAGVQTFNLAADGKTTIQTNNSTNQ